jgi:hypothetical protein
LSNIVETARGILAILGPMTGTRSAGVGLVRAPLGAVVQKSSYLIATIDGGQRSESVFKVAENPDTADGSWVADADGTAVPIVSNVGGRRHNLKAGSVLRFDPPLPGVTDLVTLVGPFTGGTDPAAGGLLSAVIREEAGPITDQAMFRTRMGGFPGVMLSWDASQPSDGVTVPRTRRATQAGAATQLWKELFTLLLFVSKDQGAGARSMQGFVLLDEIARRLTDRRMVDGVCVSSPDGVQVRERFRDAGRGSIYSNFYVYGLRLTATHSITMTDEREFFPWLTTTQKTLGSTAPVPGGDVEREPLETTDITYPMPQE